MRKKRRGLDPKKRSERDRKRVDALCAKSGALLAPTDINAARTFTFGRPHGAEVLIVEVIFKTRQLLRLTAITASQDSYQQFVSAVTRVAKNGPPPKRVRLSDDWMQRKLWEIAQYAKAGELGEEVDLEALELLGAPDSEPTHPALTLDYSGADTLTIEELGQRPQRLDAFYHGAAMAKLRQQFYSLQGPTPPANDSETDEGDASDHRQELRPTVEEWADSWGIDRIREVILDATLFFDAIGDHETASSLQRLVTTCKSDGLRVQLVDFLLEVALFHLQRKTR